MAAPKITYADKVQSQASLLPTNELFRFLDANEAKTVVNALADLIDEIDLELQDDVVLKIDINNNSTTVGLWEAQKIIAELATKADKGAPSTGDKDEYVPGDSYVVADNIIFRIINESVNFYKVVQNFTASNTGNVEADIAIDIGAGNIQQEVVRGTIIPIYEAGLYEEGATVYDTTRLGIARANKETTADVSDTDDWDLISFSPFLTDGSLWIGDENGVRKEIVTNELYVRNLGDVFVDEAYMTANYPGDKLGQKTVTNYQVAERTLNGWLITQIGANLSGWADYVDTRYTVGSPYSLADAATVVFPINTGTIVDSQKPLDINTMFYSAKLTLDDASVFEIGDTLTGATSGATGEIADILSNDVFIVNVSNTPFQNAEEVEAQDAATANTTAIDLEPAITGRNGDGLAITIEFKVKPDGAGANPRVKSSIDIVGGIGLIYEREFTLSKGNGVEHFYISSFTAYTLDTWEANGGKITLEAINEDLLIYDFRLILTRTHKGR